MQKVLIRGLALSALVLLTGCPFLNFERPKPEPTEDTRLAAQVVNEYMAAVEASESRSLSAGRALGSSDAATLRDRILARLMTDGLMDSTDITAILPSFLEGVKSGVGALDSLSSDAEGKGDLIGKALESGTESLTKEGRLVQRAAAAAVVAGLAQKTLQALNTHVTQPEIQARILAASVEATIRVVAAVADIPAATVIRAVTSTLVAEVTLAGNPALAQNIALGVAKAAANRENASELVQATLEGALVGAAEAAAAQGTAPGEALTQALAQVNAGLSGGNTGVTLDATLINGALTAANTQLTETLGSAPTVDTAAAVAAANETAPTAVLTVTKNGTAATLLPYAAAGHALVLATTGTTASGVTVTLSQTSGPSLGLAASPTFPLNFTVSTPGVYSLVLTVKNTGGVKSASAVVSFTVQAAPASEVSALVAAGTVSLAARNYDLARSQFAAALLSNPNDSEARVWAALLDLMATTTSPGMVDLMRNRIGLIDYPATMDELFGDNLQTAVAAPWFKGTYYQTKSGFVTSDQSPNLTFYYVRGRLDDSDIYLGSQNIYDSDYSYVNDYMKAFVPDPSGSFYSRYWKIADETSYYGYSSVGADTYFAENPTVTKYVYTSMLPNLQAPVLLPRLNRPSWMPDASYAKDTVFEYPFLLMANLAERNPAGLNSLLDGALANFFGSAFDTLMNRLDTLPSDTRITIDQNLLNAYGAPPLPGAVTLSLGKAELLAMAAPYKVYKAFAQYLASVSYEYPVSNAFPILKDFKLAGMPYIDENSNGISDQAEPFFAALPGIYHSQLLRERNASLRAASKASFLSALANLQNAVDLYQAAWADETSYYRSSYASATGDIENDPMIASISAALGNADSGLSRLSSAIANNTTIHLPISQNPALFMTTNWVWPDAAAANGSTQAVNPGAFWSENMLDPRAWLETDANGFVPRYNLRLTDWMTDAVVVDEQAVLLTPALLSSGYSVTLDETVLGSSSFHAHFPAKLSQAQKLLPGLTAQQWGSSYGFPLFGHGSSGGQFTSVGFAANPSMAFVLTWFNKAP